MKKILLLGMMVALFAFSADAQRAPERMKRSKEFHKEGKFHRSEGKNHNRGSAKYRDAKRKFMRDGKLTKSEKRKLDKIRKEDRKHVARYKFHKRKRVI